MKHATKMLVVALVLSGFAALAHAEDAADPPQVLLLGTFHFNDPGLDAVKTDGIDVFEDEIQAYLEGLAQRLAAFRPTHVLLEYSPDNEALINERYQAYRAGEFELPANEIYQLGFRIADLAGLDRVQSFDHREVQWAAEPMFAYAQEHESPEFAALQAIIAQVTEDANRDQQTLSMGELMRKHNDPERDRINMDLYLLTNVIGAGENWVGADSAASWWHRNFRMYANIQKVAEPGARVIAIGGQGHMAIIKQLADIDRRLERVPERPFL